jgi:hypothetical protein
MSNPNPQNQFKPGEVTNPNGRPKKGYSITDMFKSMLSESPEIKEALTKSILKKALAGDTSAQKMVWSYMDGMPLQKQEIIGDTGFKVNIVDYGSNPITKYKPTAQTEGSTNQG